MHYAPKPCTFPANSPLTTILNHNVCRASYHMVRTKAKKGVRKSLVMVRTTKKRRTRVCTNNAVQVQDVQIAVAPVAPVAPQDEASELNRIAELLLQQGYFLRNNGAIVRTLPSPLPLAPTYVPTSPGYSPGIGDEED